MKNLLMQADYNTSSVNFSNISPINSVSSSSSDFNQRKKSRSPKSYMPFIVIIFFVGLITFFALSKEEPKAAPTVAGAQTKKQVEVVKPIATQEVNKALSFPWRNQTEKVVSKFTYTIQNVEIRKEVIIKGQKATAVPGKVFLIITIKITNPYNKPIAINSRDFLRVIVNNSTEKLGADIHNDPVEIQAISTKYTRVGLALNETDKDIMLQVGEIIGKKELIKLDLKK